VLIPLLIFLFSLAVIAFARPGGAAPIAFENALGRERGFYLDRPAGALLGAVAMVLFGVVSPTEAIGRAVNFETLILLFSMMVICAYMVEARLFRFVSYLTLSHVHSPRRLLCAVVFVSGILSAVLVNDTVCLMTTPLVVQCCRDAKLKPLPYLLAVCFGANAGSVATPTGNPQNMIIGTLSGLPYTRFVLALGLPALLSLGIVTLCLLWLFRDELQAESGELPALVLARPAFDPRLAALCLSALFAILVGFCLGHSLAWTSLFGAAVIVLLGRRTPRRLLGQVDYVLLVFFAGLFVLVYGVGKAGLAERLFVALRPALGSTPLQQIWVFAGFTTALSQLVSNVPFVLLASQWMPLFADPPLTWLSMALVSTLAGNLTIVGSVANIIVLDTAGPDGRIGFFRFLRYGAVVTLLTTLASLLLLYLERRFGLI
jgi:Na+/H+ antiporter NhaD/arsenite permease-like protein